MVPDGPSTGATWSKQAAHCRRTGRMLTSAERLPKPTSGGDRRPEATPGLGARTVAVSWAVSGPDGPTTSGTERSTWPPPRLSVPPCNLTTKPEPRPPITPDQMRPMPVVGPVNSRSYRFSGTVAGPIAPADSIRSSSHQKQMQEIYDGRHPQATCISTRHYPLSWQVSARSYSQMSPRSAELPTAVRHLCT